MKIGFIGNGNMGSALAVAVSKAGYETVLYDVSKEKSALLAKKTNGTAVESIKALIDDCSFVFIGVKPQMLSSLSSELKPILDAKKDKAPLIISMAAGTCIEKIKELFGKDLRIIRIMPNTPVGYGEGMTLWCPSENVGNDDKDTFCDMMKESGKIDLLEEKFIDAASAISGCGPAFVYMFIEALADGGVLCGLPRSKAVKYASQTLLGAATLLMESNEHPGKLKDDVCSPGGTTIEGVRTLELHGFRSSAIDAVCASYEKTLELAKKK